MDEQQNDVGATPQTHLIVDLIGQLENGSTTAEATLVGIANSTSVAAIDVAKRDVAQASALRQRVVLNELATSAAAGSPYSLELLLRFIIEKQLSLPAISRLVESPSAVDDIQQDVLVAVADSIHRFRSEANFTTWLYALARNRSIAHIRKHKPTTPLRSDDARHLKAGGGTGNAPRRMSSLVADRDRLRIAVDDLPSKYRETVILRDIEGRSFAEIAELQGLEISTVRTRLSRGRAMLAAKLP